MINIHIIFHYRCFMVFCLDLDELKFSKLDRLNTR